jgi:hypothetical protein
VVTTTDRRVSFSCANNINDAIEELERDGKLGQGFVSVD